MTIQPFMSTVMGTLDSKGRVCIPAAYRQILSAQNTNGVYVCPSFFESALEGFGQSVLDGLHTRLSALDPFLSVAHDDTAYAIISRTQLLPADEQGRVRLPDQMIEHAALKDKIVSSACRRNFRSGTPNASRLSMRNASRA